MTTEEARNEVYAYLTMCGVRQTKFTLALNQLYTTTICQEGIIAQLQKDIAEEQRRNDK